METLKNIFNAVVGIIIFLIGAFFIGFASSDLDKNKIYEVTENDVKNNPNKFHNKKVKMQTTYESGFEVTKIGQNLWALYDKNAIVRNEPVKVTNYKPYNVSVIGTITSKPGKKYGHLGSYDGEIIINEMLYL